jgi:hypothetical protein
MCLNRQARLLAKALETRVVVVRSFVETAFLAMAASRGWMNASDDQGRAFQQLAQELIGNEQLIDPAFIVNAAQEQGMIFSDDAQRILAAAKGP